MLAWLDCNTILSMCAVPGVHAVFWSSEATWHLLLFLISSGFCLRLLGTLPRIQLLANYFYYDHNNTVIINIVINVHWFIHSFSSMAGLVVNDVAYVWFRCFSVLFNPYNFFIFSLCLFIRQLCSYVVLCLNLFIILWTGWLYSTGIYVPSLAIQFDIAMLCCIFMLDLG